MPARLPAPTRRPASARLPAILRTPLGVTGAALLALVLVTAVLAPLLWGDAAEAVDTAAMLQGPSADHWAGTDNLGRDLLFRTLVATRLSVALALAATALAVTVGLLLGTASLLLGPRAGRLVTAGVNIAVAFPGLLLALSFAVIFGVGQVGSVLAIGLSGAPAFARLCQTLVAGVATRDYLAAARLAGVGRLRILLRHVLPDVGGPLVVNVTIGAGGALLSFAGLSFLGLGVQAPAYDWGRLMQDGLDRIYLDPLAALLPGFAVVVAGLAFNLTGEAVARTFSIDSISGVSLLAGGALRTRRRPDAGGLPGQDATPSADVPLDAGPDLVLDVADLVVTVPTPAGRVRPVRGVTFQVARGEAVGVVGESGSGKTLTALAVARLLEPPTTVTARRLSFQGRDLLTGDHRTLLGTELAMVFQDPASSFNPVRRMGGQLAEGARHHLGLSRRQARDRAVDRLRSVRIGDPDRRAGQYPHEFSGGMRQRAMIGLGLMGSPALIVADEPTTALDVTVQRQVLDLLAEVRERDAVALLLISHDVSVVADVCDRVLVMYAGRVVEDLPAAGLATSARHPYTRALVAAVPHLETDLDRPLAVIPGRPVDPADLAAGCPFAPRCPLADARCRAEDPELVDGVACWRPGEDLPSAVPEEATA
ncbi:oligopeptide/dipeptide ABC transporter, ATP-binding protein, C-terminal domain-containing protein [Promicromonospora umidemergens]|uniref:Dipeptide/oligopeptide/nickel ABC transporter permease/ATP-binding protein n=1 Tax=Promicromonospora umidemergens TaxID=629679 RepID=A0ABP8XBR3_9MICO|nr:dipeptide/oligopeptide/nickel ABC transporter permease/ATP-binding protein [Promicromonospora umidemergens]MCP2283093.1 oligopeptide/dipeptide ABC transporter, ATP-binding protein, C-terminal domain-containing protein [Promicromonospora umidemergens]